MPLYSYTALAESGIATEGERAAMSPDDLRRELAGLGLLVQRVRRVRPAFFIYRRDGNRPENFLLFNQELLALLRAGLTVPQALTLAAKRPDHPALGHVLARVLDEVRSGATLSEACAVHPETFDPLYIAALKTGEKTGNLPQVLVRYQDYLKNRVAVRRKVSHALAYPVFLLITLSVILAVLFAFVMPRFVTMYADFGAQLPLPTRLLIGVVQHLPWLAPAFALAAAGAWFTWRSYTSTVSGQLAIDQWKERLPYYGRVRQLLATAQLARTLSTLLAGGTPLVEAMRTAEASFSNRAYAARLESATRSVTEGQALARAMQAARLAPETAIKMIEVGEASGSLDQMLADIAQFYEELLESRLARMMALVEPVLMLLMGVLIGGIIIVMYLPIFSLAEIIR